jgi:hypothetical protein
MMECPITTERALTSKGLGSSEGNLKVDIAKIEQERPDFSFSEVNDTEGQRLIKIWTVSSSKWEGRSFYGRFSDNLSYTLTTFSMLP